MEMNPEKPMEASRNKGSKKTSLKKEKSSVILSFIDIKPSHKNRRKLVLFKGSVVIAKMSSKQWEVHGKRIIAVFYVPFLLLSFMSLKKGTVSKNET